MDICKGGDLVDRCATLKTEYQKLKVVEQLLHGLSYLHSRGVCHRDLKLENVMFETEAEDSTLKLIDFGK